MTDFNAFNATSHPIIYVENDWNSLLHHGLEKTPAYIVRVNGSYYEAIQGGDTSDAGTITYGGEDNAGTVDGTSAHDVIQAAIDGLTASRTWKETVCLKGAFSVAEQIALDDYTIIDARQAFLQATSALAVSTALLYANAKSYIDIVGGIYDANKAATVATHTRCIYLNDTDDVTINNVYLENACLAGLDVRGCDRMLISNSQSNSNGRNDSTVGAGFYIRTNAGGTSCTDIHLTNCIGNSNGLGVGLDGAGLQTYGADTNVHTTNFTAHSNTRYGIKFQCEGGSTLTGADLSSNYFGINFPDAANVTVKNLTSAANTSYNILVGDDSDNILIDGFLSSGSTSAAGVKVTATTTNLVMMNGISKENTGDGFLVDGVSHAIFKNLFAIDNKLDTNSGFVITDGDDVTLDTVIGYDTRGAGNEQVYGINFNAAVTNGKIINCTCYENKFDSINAYTSAVVRYGNIVASKPSENYGSSTGTAAQQTIAHGLWTTPSEVVLYDIESGAGPYQSAAADATNIYVTAAVNQDWGWRAKI